MKKLTILAVLLAVISAATYAAPISETSSFQIVAKSDVKYEFTYSSKNRGDVCVTIYNEEGDIMSSKTVKDAKLFKRTYDFRKLQPGNYKIVVKNESGTTNQIIKYNVKEEHLKAFVGKLPDSNAIKLHVGEFNNSKAVIINIYNQDNKLIHRDKIKTDGSFSRVYNLKKISTKYVKVLVENDGEIKSFTHSLN